MLKKLLVFSLACAMLFSPVFPFNASASTVTGDLSTGLNSNVGNMTGVVVAAPTPSIAAGDYHATQTVTLAASGSTAICYTTNGAEPDCANATDCATGTLYPETPISITTSTTLKSAACYNNGTTGPVATTAYTLTCATASVSNGSVSAYPTCGISCNSGYTLSGSTCIAASSGVPVSSGGGGGVSYCSSVDYNSWGGCIDGKQTRSISARTPSGCTLTSAQQLAASQTCQAASATGTDETPSTGQPSTSASDENNNSGSSAQTSDNSGQTASGAQTASLNQILTEAQAAFQSGSELNAILENSGQSSNTKSQSSNMAKYTDPLVQSASGVTAAEKYSINNFITYGTKSTLILGGGERAGVVSSFKAAMGKIPSTEKDWNDVVKIANGRWPEQRSKTAEDRATLNFKYVYLRAPDRTNPRDDAAITVMAYGLRPAQRNLNSEAAAIKSFKAIYGYAPVKATAWDVVRAIAYSGATR